MEQTVNKDYSKADPNIECSLFETSALSKNDVTIREDTVSESVLLESRFVDENEEILDKITESSLIKTSGPPTPGLYNVDPNIENTLLEASYEPKDEKLEATSLSHEDGNCSTEECTVEKTVNLKHQSSSGEAFDKGSIIEKQIATITPLGPSDTSVIAEDFQDQTITDSVNYEITAMDEETVALKAGSASVEKHENGEEIARFETAETSSINAATESFVEEPTLMLFREQRDMASVDAFPVSEQKNVGDMQTAETTDSAKATRRKSAQLNLTRLKNEAIASRLPKQKPQLSNASDLLDYAKARLEDYSFLINENFCDTSTLCANCCALKSDLELLTEKMESMVLETEKPEIKRITHMDLDSIIEKELNFSKVLLDQKDTALNAVYKEREMLIARCDELADRLITAQKDVESYKCVLEIESGKKMKQLETLQGELATAKILNDEYKTALEKSRKEYESTLLRCEEEKCALVNDFKQSISAVTNVVNELRKERLACKIEQEDMLRANERHLLAQESRKVMAELRKEVAGDNCSDAEVFLNDVLSCVELALSTIFGSSTVSDCINVFAAKGRGTVEMNRTMQKLVDDLKRENENEREKFTTIESIKNNCQKILDHLQKESSLREAKEEEFTSSNIFKLFTSSHEAVLQAVNLVDEKLSTLQLQSDRAEKVHEDYEKQREVVLSLEAQLTELKTALSHTEKELHDQELKNAHLIEDATEQAEKNQLLEVDIERKDKEIKRLNDACDDADDECQQLREEIFDLKCAIARLECEKEGVVNEAAILRKVGCLPVPKTYITQQQNTSKLGQAHASEDVAEVKHNGNNKKSSLKKAAPRKGNSSGFEEVEKQSCRTS